MRKTIKELLLGLSTFLLAGSLIVAIGFCVRAIVWLLQFGWYMAGKILP